MKLVLTDGGAPGVLNGDTVVDVSAIVDATDGGGQETMERIITNFGSLRSSLQRASDESPGVPLADVRLSAPLPRPGKIMAMGTNFREGIHSPGPNLPTWGFFKSPEAVLAPNGRCVLPPDEFRVCHHEAELVVVIGQQGRQIPAGEAMEYVFGYCCGVDVSVRPIAENAISDLPNTLLGKSYDTFAPFGPCIVTKDEIPHPEDLAVRLWVNGELRQNYSTSDCASDVARCIEYFSSRTTLHPGDILFFGCNHQGLGPLQDGDRVEMEITGLPRLGFDVSDPLRRSWPRVTDDAMAANARARILAYQEQVAERSRSATAT